MNKKLFSWKALAGLALLVAMGMTSCKNHVRTLLRSILTIRTTLRLRLNLVSFLVVQLT